MKGLSAMPSTAEFATAYAVLQSTPGKVDEATLARWTQWARLDPRLAEQLVAHIAEHWRSWDVFTLREHLSREPWPAAFGVLCENAASLMTSNDKLKIFRPWIALTMAAIPKAAGELFFIGTMKFAGVRMRAEAECATKPYLSWGYLGRDVLVNKATQREKHTLMALSRRA